VKVGVLGSGVVGRRFASGFRSRDHESDDIGGIEGSRLLKPLCMLWVVHGFRSGSWNHAFKLLHGA
jgi:hypothetical protein